MSKLTECADQRISPTNPAQSQSDNRPAEPAAGDGNGAGRIHSAHNLVMFRHDGIMLRQKHAASSPLAPIYAPTHMRRSQPLVDIAPDQTLPPPGKAYKREQCKRFCVTQASGVAGAMHIERRFSANSAPASVCTASNAERGSAHRPESRNAQVRSISSSRAIVCESFHATCSRVPRRRIGGWEKRVAMSDLRKREITAVT
ncbi:hypothetical protein KCP70_09060 [Salmonella enterica subsp. enterica]|nr:hypothetical protein KCP70_09060 [Salmonella enterica subsp. enterica]